MKKIIQIPVIIIITILLAEITFRIYNKINPSFIFPTNTYDRFRGRPFEKVYDYKLNSKGFMDLEYSEEKKTGVYRILGVGDSFVFGMVPYKYNFMTILEEKLNNHRNRKYEVINMGIPCIGVDSYYSLLLNEGLKLKPDMVICCFFVGNDFIERWEQNAGKRSYLISFLRFIFKIYPKYSGMKGKYVDRTFNDEDVSLYMTEPVFLKLEEDRSAIFRKGINKELEFVTLYLNKMNDTCVSKGIKFLVVIIPDELQVNPRLQEKFASFLSVKSLSGKYDFGRPNELLHFELEKLNINYLDLLSNFMKVSVDKDYYKKNDTHWNMAGNKLATELIFDKLEKEYVK
ncbi:MAG: hypothetical protein A2539_06960 [Elusimicrobia bacterium RIFOXYD2_FULL_34_15]|nr:MAG: hypothetical protein A2539_06960 [Elusimicrobia bacterium RIFOXYD2_FULL_34_15]